MNWGGWSAFWEMGGRAFYVWGAYGVAAVCIVLEIVALKVRRRQARRDLKQRIAAEKS